MTKTCTVCKEDLDLTSFRLHTLGAGGLHSICRPCEGIENRKRRDTKRLWVQQYKIDCGCVKCGYNKSPYALQLNHIDPTTKVNTKHTKRRAYSPEWGWERIKAEIAKCEVLCANCHAEETHKEGKYYDRTSS